MLLLYLVQDLIVVLLWNADKLAVINLRMHCPIMCQLLHRWRNTKAITMSLNNVYAMWA